MSTELKIIKGSWHRKVRESYKVTRDDAFLDLNTFYNGKDLGTNIQLTISQNGKGGETSYIHLNQEQCKELLETLQDYFELKTYKSK